MLLITRVVGTTCLDGKKIIRACKHLSFVSKAIPPRSKATMKINQKAVRKMFCGNITIEICAINRRFFSMALSLVLYVISL
ncbi:hypothetical protein M3Y96_00487500 [Aphelenchoides besseyi]|nr:hypothetical protein M3Y96_00487500 [Aphelenchoides besseyi]